jgi:hypothetical protein
VLVLEKLADGQQERVQSYVVLVTLEVSVVEVVLKSQHMIRKRVRAN